MFGRVFTIVFLGLTVVVSLSKAKNTLGKKPDFSGPEGEKRKAQWECTRNCFDSDNADLRKGETVCTPGDDFPPRTPCRHKCYELPTPDPAAQQQCFCDQCKKWEGYGFCREKPDGSGGDKQIKLEECEETVCKGDNEVRYRYHYCESTSEENEDYGADDDEGKDD